jgi:hypothetical protein
MSNLDDAFVVMAYMAFLNDPSPETADNLAAALADQHPERLAFEELSRVFRSHVSELQCSRMLDASGQAGVNLLNKLIADCKGRGLDGFAA